MRRTLLVLLFFISILVASEGYKRKRVTIPDDVVDDEDDDAWEQWGLKKSGSGPDKNLPPPNFSKMDPSKIQELMKQHTGPSYGFVKLRFGVSRSKVDVQNIATKWSKMLKTGSIDVRFMATDLNTFMFTMEKGQDLEELKEFILSQRDAYEVKIGDQTYRRPRDPPLDQVIERLRREKHSSDKRYNNEL
ncbi:Chaperone for wingless signaling and trafficking of LDL receptor [Carex littledalei]|uniref:Chaperone for wingless signaling and trafficking of LDL receptor n=1 Tax=Carex littledalei TaxID=544730 RepID=A0A833R389_9POAL|nr:Chaperone for wingless signaling and trafficking of LDL receptor [Carex littledalei]